MVPPADIADIADTTAIPPTGWPNVVAIVVRMSITTRD